ncbi:MAG: hypothetical protein WD991_00735 [Candidatus Paceibacterota bacterium]
MSLNDPTRLNKIEDLKNKLFSKSYKARPAHHDRFTRLESGEIRDSWGSKAQVGADLGARFFMQTSLFKKFFIFSAIFFLITLGYGSYMFFFGGNIVSNDNIDISVIGNTFAAGGEELPLQISIANKNNSALELVDLILEYPKSSDGSMSDTERNRISLGTIPPGSVRNEHVKVVLFGEQGSVRPIKITLEYRVEGSNAIFIKEIIYEVNISSTPIDITVTAPASISPNQDMTLDIKATLNSIEVMPKTMIKVDYPVGFQFVSSNPAPSLGNNIWELGDLAPGASKNVSIIGKMIDVFDGEEKTFRIISGSQSSKDKSIIDVVFNSLGHTVQIGRPAIEASLYINGVYQREYAVNSKGNIAGEIRWANNMDTRVNDLVIRAKISGNAVDEKSISAERGFYDSLNDAIIWDKNSTSRFASVNPGDRGEVAFSMSPASLFSGSGIISSPTIRVDISITGKQAVEGYETENLNNSEQKTIKVISDVALTNKAIYFSGPFQNTGPIPPKVETETTYTIVWSLANTSNNISKAVARSSLPAWMRFVGNISPTSADLSYNSSTREIVWNIGSIPKGTGLNAAAKEVAFKVAISPSLSQLGLSPIIINEVVLTGHDDFANVDIRLAKPPLSTRLSSDPAFPAGGDRVVE